ncbi:MAG: hypothetical protein J6M95_01630 [Bacilli bacterium]|nr:hypothetical protein [Bacilli bacterium]
MKKKTFKVNAILTAVCSVGALVTLVTSCSQESGGGGGVVVDETKTQIYIKNYQGGYGNKWLYSAKTRYEELHAEDSYESGKKGLQIIIADQKARPSSAEIKNGTSELYFFESINYHTTLADNAFEDITEFVTGDNPYEPGKTIESKMFDFQRDFLNMKDSNGNSHYYAIPHYIGNFGIVYNKTVFREKGYYFAEDYQDFDPVTESEFRFVETPTSQKSVGPDGIAGTNDDGLPTTYDEFYELCNYIKDGGNVPLVWMGKNGGGDYFGALANSLASFYEGAEQAAVTYTYNGEVDVVKLNADGTDVERDAEGNLIYETKTVHPNKVNGAYDGAEVMRTAGKYHALDFVDRIMDESYNPNGSHKGNWELNIISNSSSHLDAQNYFINSQFGRLDAHGSQRSKSIAMIFEGNWWYSEASEVIDSLAETEKDQLDFGWMPLPKADAHSNSKQTVLFDNESYVFVKRGVPAFKKAIIGDFIQYMNTDEALQEFTTKTNAIKSFKYTMTDENKKEMSNFGRDFWEYFQNADIVFPYSHEKQYMNTIGTQLSGRRYAYSTNITFCQNEFTADPSLTAGKYIAKMYKYYKGVYSTAA